MMFNNRHLPQGMTIRLCMTIMAVLVCLAQAMFLSAEDSAVVVNPPAALPAGLDTEAAFLARISGLFMVEDPTSLYDFNISDKQVEFILDGSWEMKLDGVTTISFADGAPALAITPPVFNQVVDLSSWVFIDKTWYFESTFTEQFTKNTVAAGYIGGEDDIIKHVRLGNSGITFPDRYPFIRIGGGKAIAPGVMGTFAGDTWKADAIVRYDSAATRLLTLSGMNEITDDYVPITALIQGKWFVLPDAPVTGAVTVYVSDSDGPIHDAKGRRWRKLNAAEFRVSGIDGTIELVTEATGSVAVVYGGDYASGPGSSLNTFVDDTRSFFESIPMTIPANCLPLPAGIAARFLLTLEGQTALMLREKGYFSPFALASRYAATGTDLDAVFRESGVTPDYLEVLPYNGSWAELRRTDIPASDIRTPEARYPLAPVFPLLYFPSYGGQKPDTDLAIRSRGYKPLTTISLGTEVIAGTIQVSRDGIFDTAFHLDDSTGLLTLEQPPRTNETIRITWLDSDPSTRNATLTLGGGIEWDPRESLALTLGTALRWNVAKNGFTDYSANSPGSLILSTGLAYTGTVTTASTAFAFDLTVPDTTGYYRIAGMDTSPQTFYPASTWYKATPDDFEQVLGAPYNPSATIGDALSVTDRVALDGTDGTSLRTITDSSVSGDILAMDCALPSSAAWASADILTGALGGTDFRSAGTVAIALKNAGTQANFDVFLQLGTVNADDYEDFETVRTWKLTTPAAGSSWTVRTVTLTDDDRRSLSAGNNLRVVVMPAPAAVTPLEVHLRTGPVEVTESGFTAAVAPAFTTGTVSVKEIHDSSSPALIVAQPDIINRFNSGGVNTILETEFTPDSAVQTVTVARNIPALPMPLYNYLSFFIRPETAAGHIRISLTRPDSTGSIGANDTALELELDAAALTAGQWQKITVDLQTRSVSLDGATLSSTNAVITSFDRTIQPTHLAVSFIDWPIGSTSVSLDEFYLEQTDPDYTVRNESKFSWKKSGALLSIGKTAFISDPSFSATALSSKSTSQEDPVVSGTASGGLKLLRARADGSVTASSSTSRLADSTNHSVSIPFGPFALSEQFSPDFVGNTYRRENALSFSGPLSAGISTAVQMKGRNLERRDNLRLSPSIPAFKFGQLAFSVDSAFTQTGIAPVTDISDTAWSDLWKDSFRYSLSTGESDAARRNGKTDFHTGWTNPSSSKSGISLSAISFDVSAASAYTSGSATTLGSTISLNASTPFKIGSTTLTPAWLRTAIQTRNAVPGGSYQTDTAFLPESFADQTWLYQTAPFADLFASDIDATIRSDGIYSRTFSNRYSLLWSRPSPGRLSDLWTPNSLDMSINRETRTDATAANILDEYSASVKAGFSALNIAGTFGILHAFDWFEQDEYSQLYSWSSRWGKGYYTWNLDTWHSAMLFFAGTGTMVAENAFHYDSPSIAGTGELYRDTVRAIWKRPGKTSFMRDLISHWTKMALTTRREDSASFSLTKDTALSTNFAYDHLLVTGVGANGEILASAGVGVNRSSLKVLTVELRLSLGGKLTY